MWENTWKILYWRIYRSRFQRKDLGQDFTLMYTIIVNKSICLEKWSQGWEWIHQNMKDGEWKRDCPLFKFRRREEETLQRKNLHSSQISGSRKQRREQYEVWKLKEETCKEWWPSRINAMEMVGIMTHWNCC